MKSNIKIQSAKIIKGTTCSLEYKVTEKDQVHYITDESEAPIHKDLQEAFRKLVPHLMIMGELSKHPGIVVYGNCDKFGTDLEDEEIESERELYNCTGFNIQKDGESIILHGNKKLSNGKVWNFVLPLQNLESYEPVIQLDAVLEECYKELNEYINGKSAQIALFGNVEPSESEINKAGEIVKKQLKDDKKAEVDFEFAEVPEKPKAKVKSFADKKPLPKKVVKKSPFDKEINPDPYPNGKAVN